MAAVATVPMVHCSHAGRRLVHHHSLGICPRRQDCRCRRFIAAAANSLVQQQQQLTTQLAGVLRQRRLQRQSDAVADAVQLVHQGTAALLASPDWMQLQQTFQLAARQCNAAAAASQAFNKANASHSATSSTSIDVSSGNSSRLAGSSPWGFALRQPKQQAMQQPVHHSTTSSNASEAAGGIRQQQLQQHQLQWDWAGVQHFMMLGQGSLSKLCGSSTPASTMSPPPRLGLRFFQLVIAVALQRSLLPGLTSQPTAYDPDYDPFDHALLEELGFKVLEDAPSCDVACSGAALLYMPCCPRELYAAVLAANDRHLQQLAIFGTSMRSFADTQQLLEALTAEPAVAAAAAAAAGAGDALGVTNTEGDSGGEKQSRSAESRQCDVLQLAYQRGCVLELPCPDCAAHAVGVGVHLFPGGSLH